VVEKLTKNVTENHIREIFGDFGDIEYLDLPINKACESYFLFTRRRIYSNAYYFSYDQPWNGIYSLL
jgi:RNA recognition motif-containing protein